FLHQTPLFARLFDDDEAVVLVQYAGVYVLVVRRDDEPFRRAPDPLVLVRCQPDDLDAVAVVALAEVGRGLLAQVELEDLRLDLLVGRSKPRFVRRCTLSARSHMPALPGPTHRETIWRPGAGTAEWCGCRRGPSGWPGTRPCSGSSTSASRTWPIRSTFAESTTPCGSSSCASAATSTASSGSS